MPTNFVAFRTQLEQELGDTSTRMRALLLQWSNLEYHRICRATHWSWLEATTEIEQSSASYAIPATVRKILQFRDHEITPPRELEEVGEVQFFAEGFDPAQTGEPWYWRVWGETVYFHPYPTAARTLRYDFIKQSTDLNTTDNTGLGTTLLIPDHLLSILYDAVIAKAFRFLDDTRAPAYQAESDKRLQEAVQKNGKATGIKVPGVNRRAGGWNVNGTYVGVPRR